VTDPRRPVLGVIGNDVPRQLVLAAGILPRRLHGSWTAPVDERAAALLGAADAVAARLLAQVRTEPLDGLVVCNDSQASLRVFYVLRATMPELPVHLLDLPRDDRPAARRFVRRQFEGLLAFCLRIGGAVPEPATLADAARAERAVGDARARLRERRRAQPARVRGAVALDALLDSTRLDPATAVARLDAAVDDAPTTGIRVHVTGSGHPDADVYRVLEEGGAVVVSEDHDTGDAAWVGNAVDGDDVDAVLDGLVARHFARVATSPTALSADRADITADTALDAQVDIALALIRAADEAPLWDLADQRSALAAFGLRLAVVAPVRPGAELEAAREAVGLVHGEAVR